MYYLNSHHSSGKFGGRAARLQTTHQGPTEVARRKAQIPGNKTTFAS